MRTAHLLVLGAALAVGFGCRGDDDTSPDTGTPNPDGGTPDSGVVVEGDCPVGTGDTLTVCELKLPGNPRRPSLGDPVEVANVVVTTGPVSLTRTATSGINGFFVQDLETTPELEGRYGGIIVTYFPDSTDAIPSPGDVVRIAGNLGEYGEDGFDKQTQIQLVSYTVESTQALTPRPVADPSAIATGGADAAAYEGTLIEVRDIEAIQVDNVPGSGGATIFDAFIVTGQLVVRDRLYDGLRASAGQRFTRLAGVLQVGTRSFDAGIYALNPRGPGDVEVDTEAVSGVAALQDPTSTSRPGICEQDGGPSARTGTCPPITLENVVVTAAKPTNGGRFSAYVQDPTVDDGRFAGVLVFSAALDGATELAIGDVVTVTGVPVLFYDLLELVDATIRFEQAGTPVMPTVVQAADIPGAVTLMNGEIVNPYEGVLVRLEGVEVSQACVDSNGDRGYFEVAGSVVVGNEFSYGYNGEFAEDAMCGDMSRSGDQRTVGDRFQSLSGVMHYSFGQYRLNPRNDADLVLE